MARVWQEIAKLKEANAYLKRRCDRMRIDMETEVQLIERENNLLKEDLASAEEMLEELEKKRTKSRKSKKSLKRKAEKARDAVVDRDEQISVLTTKVATLESQLKVERDRLEIEKNKRPPILKRRRVTFNPIVNTRSPPSSDSSTSVEIDPIFDELLGISPEKKTGARARTVATW